MNNKELVSTFDPKNLLVSLYHCNLTPPNVTQDEATPRQYKELHKFRSRVEEQKCGPQHQPYHASKQKATLYRAIFFCLGTLFLFLCYFMYTQTMTWSGTLFFYNYTATKASLCLFTLLLSALSFTFGYSIRTEREAVNKLINRTKNKMRRIFSYKKATFGLSSFLSMGHQFKKNTVARQAFHEAIERAYESRKITNALLNQISSTKGLDKTSMEKLFNEAILELNDKLHVIVYDFKKKLQDLLDV